MTQEDHCDCKFCKMYDEYFPYWDEAYDKYGNDLLQWDRKQVEAVIESLRNKNLKRLEQLYVKGMSHD